jgi:hypothetical protein
MHFPFGLYSVQYRGLRLHSAVLALEKYAVVSGGLVVHPRVTTMENTRQEPGRFEAGRRFPSWRGINSRRTLATRSRNQSSAKQIPRVDSIKPRHDQENTAHGTEGKTKELGRSCRGGKEGPMQCNGVGIWDTENGLFFFCYLGVENTEINLNIIS